MNSPSRKQPVVAIDGPAGAGKSTVTRSVAEVLGYTRVDTGALYRAVALTCSQRGIEFDDTASVGTTAKELAAPGAVELSTSGNDLSVVVLGEDVTEAIRSREASLGASQVSQNPMVREALLEIQRGLGRRGGVVLEGRDIGSVVVPDAEAKFYLTASAEVRAERRRAELVAKGEQPALSEIVDEVNERDRRDTERPIAPLMQAEDAIVVDSSSMSIEEVVISMVKSVRDIEDQLREACEE